MCTKLICIILYNKISKKKKRFFYTFTNIVIVRYIVRLKSYKFFFFSYSLTKYTSFSILQKFGSIPMSFFFTYFEV